MVLEIAAQRQHEAVAVNDTGFRRDHRRDAGERGFELLRLLRGDDRNPFHAVRHRLCMDGLEAGNLARLRGDDELAALAVRHAVRGGERVERPPAGRTVPGAQRAARIIKAGVNDLAVARGYAGADGVGRFRDNHLVTGKREGAGHGKPDHPCPGHEHLHVDALCLAPALCAMVLT